MNKRFVSIGEAMVEFSGGADDCYRLGFAGDTLNTAWYARAMLPGDWAVDYVTAVGDDLYSTRFVSFLSDNGIGTSHIRPIDGRCLGLYVTHQENGDRRFTYWRSTSAARQLMAEPARVAGALEDAALLYFSGITMAILDEAGRSALLDVLAARRAAGARIAFDPNVRPRLWESLDTLRAATTRAAAVADIILPTFGDEAEIFGDADPEATAQRYAAAGAGEIVVKNGEDAALILHAGQKQTIATEPATLIMDTTGAGDSFNAAYLASRLRGAAPDKSAHAAHGVARRVIAHHGALLAMDALAEQRAPN